jgi:VCBS repeat-containing protein
MIAWTLDSLGNLRLDADTSGQWDVSERVRVEVTADALRLAQTLGRTLTIVAADGRVLKKTDELYR